MPVYKKKSTGTYYVSFYYQDFTGKRIRKKKEGFLTKKDALAYEREFLLKEEGNVDMSFESLVDIYLKDCKVRLKPTTYENKKTIIYLKILPYFKEVNIKKIDAIRIRKWQNILLSDKNSYSQTYLKSINNQISAIFNYAVQYYDLPKNPARTAGSIGKKKAEAMKFWTKDEFNLFEKGIENNFFSKIMFQILFYTGIRVGELLALTLEDFNFEKKSLFISKTYTRYKKNDLIQEPKTPKSKREILLPKKLCQDIQEFATARYDYQKNERLFPFTKFFLHHEMDRGCKKTGVKKIRIHDLRHSHASLLIEMGFPILVIAERLGHEDIQTTLQTYGHLYPNKQEEIVKKLEEIEIENNITQNNK